MIVAAAVKMGDLICTMPPPNRHHNILWAIDGVHPDRPDEKKKFIVSPAAKGEQGFIDDKGNFVGREIAAIHAAHYGQLKKSLIAPPNLYSEDLW